MTLFCSVNIFSFFFQSQFCSVLIGAVQVCHLTRADQPEQKSNAPLCDPNRCVNQLWLVWVLCCVLSRFYLLVYILVSIYPLSNIYFFPIIIFALEILLSLLAVVSLLLNEVCRGGWYCQLNMREHLQSPVSLSV